MGIFFSFFLFVFAFDHGSRLLLAGHVRKRGVPGHRGWNGFHREDDDTHTEIIWRFVSETFRFTHVTRGSPLLF